jgi:putative transposase
MSRSKYYYWVKVIQNRDKYLEEKDIIKYIFRDNNGTWGYRRVGLGLRKFGYSLNHKTVQRLMQEMGLKSKVRMKKYNSYRGGFNSPIAPNILNREFRASKPNEKWVTDITEFKLFGETLYLSPILDLYNGEIIAYEINRRQGFDLILGTITKALEKKMENDTLILHSDQGWQYRTEKYKELLRENNITQSMSRKANCLDNAVMENFFGHLKSELFYLKKFDSMEHFISELREYIDYWNNKRIKVKLNGLSPVQYRIQSQLVA